MPEKTDVRRISSIQFLRDRELGIRGTGERTVRQQIRINENYVYSWIYHVRRRLYTWMRDNMCVFDDKENKYDRAKKIADQIRNAVYIKISAGSGRCIELLAVGNAWDTEYTRNRVNERWMGKFDVYEYYEMWEQDDRWRGMTDPRFNELSFRLEQCRLLNVQRYCNSCEENTCKCSVEECYTI